MFSTSYSDKFASLLNNSITRDDHIVRPSTDKLSCNHNHMPIDEDEYSRYDFAPYLQSENSATIFRDHISRSQLNDRYHDMLFFIPPDNSHNKQSKANIDHIYNDNDTFDTIDNSLIPIDVNALNKPIHDYPIEQTDYTKRIKPISFNTDENKYLPNEHGYYTNYNNNLSSAIIPVNYTQGNLIRSSNTNSANMNFVRDQKQTNYDLINVVNESFSLNKPVTIKYKNKIPTTCNMSVSERFCSALYNEFGREAFSNTDNTLTTEQFTYKDSNDAKAAPIAINAYLDTLKARAVAVCHYLQNNKSYKKWSDNWTLLANNLKKSKLLFERLDESDADIAYVINKGEEVKFRIRDEKRFIPINVYQYVLYHEMAHMSTTELQHTKFFHELLNLISLAAMENGFIDLSRLKMTYYRSNGQPILCKISMKQELYEGCDLMIKNNPDSAAYWNMMRDYISKK